MQDLIINLMKAARLEAEMTGEKVSPELESQLKLWGAGIFRLVVMGEIKKGKSSFINAMLGVKDLVPVSSNVATSTIFKIRYARERGYRVYFLPECKREPLNINEYDLAAFGTEDGNPGNREQVDFIEVMCPSALLSTGIVIIDTPGLGGLFKAHKRITYQYVPRADAVFFVTDSVESPIGALEIEYLREILKITPNLYFVQTKTGAVDEEDCATRKKSNLAILSEALHMPAQNIPYFLSDSKLRFSSQKDRDNELLAMSGYPQLMAFINDVLQPNQQKILAARAMLRMQPIFTHLHELTAEEEKICQADTAEKREQYKAEIETRQEELRAWQEKDLPKLQNELATGMRDIRLSAVEMCSQLRPSGEVQQSMEKILEAADDARAVAEKAEQINAELPEYVTRVHQEIIQSIRTKTTSLLSVLSEYQTTASSTEVTEIRHSGDPDLNIRQLHVIELSSTFDKMRTATYGGIAGITIASIVGGIIGSVIPVVGTIAGSWLGTIVAGGWGGYKAIEIKNSQEVLAARNQVCNQLAQCFASIHHKIQQAIERTLFEVENGVRAQISDYIHKRKYELEEKLTQLQERARMSAEEQKKQISRIQAHRSLLESIERDVRARFDMMSGKQKEENL